MNFPFFIARRYLFSRKRVGAINVISGISVGGVALATMAMVCVLSGFNGFRDLIGSLFTTFDPQLEVVPAQGKSAAADDPALEGIRRHPAVEAVSACYEDHALILFKGRPTVITLKGVDEAFRRTSQIDSILYGDGTYRLESAGINYGIPGYGLAVQMGGLDFNQLQICAPKPGERINLSNPIENINVDEISSPGVCFQVHQQKYDNSYLLVPLAFAQNLFEQQGLVTQLELKLKTGTDEEKAKQELQALGGSRFRVLDRYEQQEDTFNVMKIEKMFAFAFLAFIVLVACFNIIGCLSMLIIDKRKDIDILRHLGAADRTVVRIFLFEGRLITFFGATLGILLGLLLCWLQQEFGLLRLGGDADSFIISAYPVSVHASDIVEVFVTVIVVGFVAVWYPVKYMSRRLLEREN